MIDGRTVDEVVYTIQPVPVFTTSTNGVEPEKQIDVSQLI
jgi:hypothetical protein